MCEITTGQQLFWTFYNVYTLNLEIPKRYEKAHWLQILVATGTTIYIMTYL